MKLKYISAITIIILLSALFNFILIDYISLSLFDRFIINLFIGYSVNPIMNNFDEKYQKKFPYKINLN